MKHRILNKIYEVLFVPPSKLKDYKKAKRANGKTVVEEARGDCDPPTAKNKTIRISNKLPEREELEVTIHECLHAADWHKDEVSWIEPVADDIARLLWKLGWRKAKGGPNET